MPAGNATHAGSAMTRRLPGVASGLLRGAKDLRHPRLAQRIRGLERSPSARFQIPPPPPRRAQVKRYLSCLGAGSASILRTLSVRTLVTHRYPSCPSGSPWKPRSGRGFWSIARVGMRWGSIPPRSAHAVDTGVRCCAGQRRGMRPARVKASMQAGLRRLRSMVSARRKVLCPAAW